MKSLRHRLVRAIALAALGISGSALSQQPADCSIGPIPDQALELTIGSEKIPSLAWVSVRKISEMRLDDDVYEQYEVTAQDKERCSRTSKRDSRSSFRKASGRTA